MNWASMKFMAAPASKRFCRKLYSFNRPTESPVSTNTIGNIWFTRQFISEFNETPIAAHCTQSSCFMYQFSILLAAPGQIAEIAPYLSPVLPDALFSCPISVDFTQFFQCVSNLKGQSTLRSTSPL